MVENSTVKSFIRFTISLLVFIVAVKSVDSKASQLPNSTISLENKTYSSQIAPRPKRFLLALGLLGAGLLVHHGLKLNRRKKEERRYRNNLRKSDARYGRGGRRQMDEDSDFGDSDDDDSEEIANNNGKMRRTQTLSSMGGGHPMMNGMNSQYGQQPMMMMPQKPQLMKSASAGSRQMPDPSMVPVSRAEQQQMLHEAINKAFELKMAVDSGCDKTLAYLKKSVAGNLDMFEMNVMSHLQSMLNGFLPLQCTLNGQPIEIGIKELTELTKLLLEGKVPATNYYVIDSLKTVVPLTKKFVAESIAETIVALTVHQDIPVQLRTNARSLIADDIMKKCP